MRTSHSVYSFYPDGIFGKCQILYGDFDAIFSHVGHSKPGQHSLLYLVSQHRNEQHARMAAEATHRKRNPLDAIDELCVVHKAEHRALPMFEGQDLLAQWRAADNPYAPIYLTHTNGTYFVRLQQEWLFKFRSGNLARASFLIHTDLDRRK